MMRLTSAQRSELLRLYHTDIHFTVDRLAAMERQYIRNNTNDFIRAEKHAAKAARLAAFTLKG